jgi:TolA-binding protein
MKLSLLLPVTIILLLPLGLLQARDYKKTEDIINSILDGSDSGKIERPGRESDTDTRNGDIKEGDEERGPEKVTRDQVLLRTGIDLYNSSLYDNARETFQELLDTYPSSQFRDSAHVWLGKIAMRQNRYQEARENFGRVPEQSGEYPSAQFHTAETLARTGQLIEAIGLYRLVASRFPDHELADNALLATGRLYRRQKKGNQSLMALLQLIRYYGDRETVDDAYYLLGRLFESDPRLKDLERARRFYRIFIKKADGGETHFKSSPLLPRVRRDLRHLESTHFMID